MYMYLIKLILSFDTYKYYIIVPTNIEFINILNTIAEHEILNDDYFFELLINFFISRMINSESGLEKQVASELLEITEKVKHTINICKDNINKSFKEPNDEQKPKGIRNNGYKRKSNDWCWDSLVIKEFNQIFPGRY